MLDVVTQWATWGLQTGGYFGAAVLMALESMIAPIPSELVMPPMGMLIKQGKMDWTWAIMFSSLGSLAGSLFSYWLGMVGGRPTVLKIGKFLLLNEHHLDLTTHWFQKRGGITVFISRFVPVVRHFISIPAGMGRMNLWKFCLYTLLGATIWNTGLLIAGYKLQEHWHVIETYRTPIDIAVVVALGIGIVLWFVLNRRHASTAQPAPAASQNPAAAETSAQAPAETKT